MSQELGVYWNTMSEQMTKQLIHRALVSAINSLVMKCQSLCFVPHWFRQSILMKVPSHFTNWHCLDSSAPYDYRCLIWTRQMCPFTSHPHLSTRKKPKKKSRPVCSISLFRPTIYNNLLRSGKANKERMLWSGALFNIPSKLSVRHWA